MVSVRGRAPDLQALSIPMVLSHSAMHALDNRLGDSQCSIHAPSRSLLKEHDHTRLVEEQPPNEVVTHAPELCQLFD